MSDAPEPQSESDDAARGADAAMIAWPDAVLDPAQPLHVVMRDLREAADDESREDREALALLAQVASYHLSNEDSSRPYGPMFVLEGQRSAIPEDLDATALETLRSVAQFVPHTLLKARAYDVVGLLSTGRERMEASVRNVGAVADYLDTCDGWTKAWPSIHEEVARALELGLRFGGPAKADLQRIEDCLTDAVTTEALGYGPLRAAELLFESGLARGSAAAIAECLAEIGGSAAAGDLARNYRQHAAKWFIRAGDKERAEVEEVAVIRSFVDESEALGVGADAAQQSGRAAHLCESALAALTRLPRASRQKHGVEALDVEMRERIRVYGAQMLSTMHRHSFEGVDLSGSAAATEARLTGKDALDMLLQFVAMWPLADYATEVASAEARLAEHPLRGLFGAIHLSHDGRVVKRTAAGGTDETYGVDAQKWRQMVQSHGLRVQAVVVGHIEPGRLLMVRERRISRQDLYQLVVASASVPPHHEVQFATGLERGLYGDFISSAHILAPQIENLVRFHLKAAGFETSLIVDGIESEVGLSALAERGEFVDVLGADLAFELRALMCDSAGPNLRNDVAHGLITDGAVHSAATAYLWWLALRIVVLGYAEHFARRGEGQSDGDSNRDGEGAEDDTP